MATRKLRTPPPLSEQLRTAIAASGVSCYRIAKDTGVDKAVLSRFVNGQAGLSLETVDQVGQYLGLSLVAKVASKSK